MKTIRDKERTFHKLSSSIIRTLTFIPCLFMFGFDGLSVACTYFVEFEYESYLMVMFWNALEPRTTDGQRYMWGNYH